MNDERNPSQPARSDPSPRQDADRPAYEPPRLTHVGNLRDLIGKTGNQFDFRLRRVARP